MNLPPDLARPFDRFLTAVRRAHVSRDGPEPAQDSQAAHDAACVPVQALRKTNHRCRYTVRDRTDHSGPCAVTPSAHDVVMAVLGAVATQLARRCAAQVSAAPTSPEQESAS